jgi:hypothetical protein
MKMSYAVDNPVDPVLLSSHTEAMMTIVAIDAAMAISKVSGVRRNA